MTFFYAPSPTPWLETIYQDETLWVVNKPSGVLSVPGKAPDKQDSILSRIHWQFPKAEAVHRLDLVTSGLLIIALNKNIERDLRRQFRERLVDKTYLARVWGWPKKPQGIINLPLICDWPRRPKQMVSFSRGKEAITYYECLSKNQTSTLIKLTPITGRSHQLRLHLFALGHPILGDNLYGNFYTKRMAPRLLLHATSLSFIHPLSKKRLSFFSPAPFL